MPTLLIEEDHFLKIVPVILDPDIPDAHRRAVADFFAHDVPDFLGWCDDLRARMPGLYPTRVVWADDQADFLALASNCHDSGLPMVNPHTHLSMHRFLR